MCRRRCRGGARRSSPEHLRVRQLPVEAPTHRAARSGARPRGSPERAPRLQLGQHPGQLEAVFWKSAIRLPNAERSLASATVTRTPLRRVSGTAPRSAAAPAAALRWMPNPCRARPGDDRPATGPSRRTVRPCPAHVADLGQVAPAGEAGHVPGHPRAARRRAHPAPARLAAATMTSAFVRRDEGLLPRQHPPLPSRSPRCVGRRGRFRCPARSSRWRRSVRR